MKNDESAEDRVKDALKVPLSYLFKTGKVEVDSKDTETGRTPLSYAVKGEHETVIKQLQCVATTS
jgi:hypothetical protein